MMNFKNKIVCLSAAALFLMAALPSAADTIYKWTDAQGRVHFTQQPSTDHQSTMINTDKTRPFGQSAFDGKEETQAPSKAPAAKTPVPEAAKVEEAKVEKSAELCKKAQANKETLMGKLRVRQNGKVLTVDERQNQLQYMEQIIKANC